MRIYLQGYITQGALLLCRPCHWDGSGGVVEDTGDRDCYADPFGHFRIALDGGLWKVWIDSILHSLVRLPPEAGYYDLIASLVQDYQDITIGGLGYTHTQTMPASLWAVAHNLGRRPSAVLVWVNDLVMQPAVEHLDNNHLQANMNANYAGILRCS